MLDWLLQVLTEGRFKGPEELAAVFAGAGVDTQRPIITSCGTGVTASILALALHRLSPASQVRWRDAGTLTLRAALADCVLCLA